MDQSGIQTVFKLSFSGQAKSFIKYISIDTTEEAAKINENFNGEEVLYIAISRSDPNIAYALTHMNSVYKSIDAGNTWKKIR